MRTRLPSLCWTGAGQTHQALAAGAAPWQVRRLVLRQLWGCQVSAAHLLCIKAMWCQQQGCFVKKRVLQ